MWKKRMAILLSAIMFVNPIHYCKANIGWELDGYSLDRVVEEEKQEVESTEEVQTSTQETAGLGEYDKIEDIAEGETTIQETDEQETNEMEETEDKEFETTEERKEPEIIDQEAESSAEDETVSSTIKNETEMESRVEESTVNEELEDNSESVTEIETTTSTSSVQETIKVGITPEKLISSMIECEDEQNWNRYWKYWVSSFTFLLTECVSK